MQRRTEIGFADKARPHQGGNVDDRLHLAVLLSEPQAVCQREPALQWQCSKPSSLVAEPAISTFIKAVH